MVLLVWVSAAFAGDVLVAGGGASDYGFPAPVDPDRRLEQFRRDAFYVVDAYVLRRVDKVTEPGGRTRKEVRWAVVWDRRPEIGEPGIELVSSEWVVVDGTGRLLTPAQYAALGGEIGAVPARGHTVLGGVQRVQDREAVEEASAARIAQAAARANLAPSEVEPERERALALLPPPRWAATPPAPLE